MIASIPAWFASLSPIQFYWTITAPGNLAGLQVVVWIVLWATAPARKAR